MRDPFPDQKPPLRSPRPGRWPADQPSYRAASRARDRNERPDERAWAGAVADGRRRRRGVIWLAAACLLVGFGLGFGAGVQARPTGGGPSGAGPSRAAGSDGMTPVPDAVVPPVADLPGSITPADGIRCMSRHHMNLWIKHDEYRYWPIQDDLARSM